MDDKEKVSLILPERLFKNMDTTIKREFSMSLGNIAVQHPAHAFQALHVGMTSLFTRRGHNTLVQQTGKPEEEPKTVAVTDRQLDGEEAFSGSVSHVMGGLVGTLMDRFLQGEEDFRLAVHKEPGIIGKIRGREATTQVVVVIPRDAYES